MRSRHVREVASLAHRDSSLVVPAVPALLDRRLITPASVHGLVAAADTSDGLDATEVLRRRLRGPDFGERLDHWLSIAAPRAAGRATFSLETEIRGETAVRRHALADLVRREVARRFAHWDESKDGDVRLLCKADPNAALLGVQLYTSLRSEPGIRAGALREHLACSLLALARVAPGDAVVDPFMGTATILRAARERFAAGACIGAESDPAAFRLARGALRADGSRLHLGSFEGVDVGSLSNGVRLVSNLPFGARFHRAPTTRLVEFMLQLGARLDGVALLADREQAIRLGQALGARVKNVLVLGQPASIVYASR